MLSIYVLSEHYEHFAYRYECVHFTYSSLGRIVDLDGNVTCIVLSKQQWLLAFT